MSGGEEWTAKDLFNRVYRYRTYWKNNGGITVSGGEPLLQIDFLLEFFCAGKGKGHPHHTGYGRKSIYQGRTVFR